MAKELPYFKFEPAEYIAKDIQDCSLEAQGAFINICCLYWIKLGDLRYASALQRVCKGNTRIITELEESGVIKVEDQQITITFLDNQLSEFEDTSKKRQKAANKRWKNADAMQVHTKSNTIREEKRREDDTREDKKIEYPWPTENFKTVWSKWKEYKRDQFKFRYKSTSTEQAALTELNKLAADEVTAIQIIHQSIGNGWKGFFQIKQNGNSKKRISEFAEAARHTDTWKSL